jgi:hypothetical protein
MQVRQFSFTGPAGLLLGLPTLHGGGAAYAIAGAAVAVLPRLLPYLFALYMHRRGNLFTVEDHGVKITLDDTIAQTPVRQSRARRAKVRRDPTQARSS